MTTLAGSAAQLEALQQLVVLQGKGITLAAEVAANQAQLIHGLTVCNDAMCARTVAMQRDFGRLVMLVGLVAGAVIARLCA